MRVRRPQQKHLKHCDLQTFAEAIRDPDMSTLIGVYLSRYHDVLRRGVLEPHSNDEESVTKLLQSAAAHSTATYRRGPGTARDATQVPQARLFETPKDGTVRPTRTAPTPPSNGSTAVQASKKTKTRALSGDGDDEEDDDEDDEDEEGPLNNDPMGQPAPPHEQVEEHLRDCGLFSPEHMGMAMDTTDQSPQSHEKTKTSDAMNTQNSDAMNIQGSDEEHKPHEHGLLV